MVLGQLLGHLKSFPTPIFFLLCLFVGTRNLEFINFVFNSNSSKPNKNFIDIYHTHACKLSINMFHKNDFNPNLTCSNITNFDYLLNPNLRIKIQAHETQLRMIIWHKIKSILMLEAMIKS